jgi:hypothetical protein
VSTVRVAERKRRAQIVGQDSRIFALMALLAFWILTFGGAFVAYSVTPPEGDGFIRGWNRITTFLGWQGVAAMISLPIWVVGRAWPKGSAVRRLASGPIIVTLLELAAVIGVVIYLQY